jgi:hypothetical protein
MASTSRQLDDEDVMNILYESDECLVSSSSDESDSDYEDLITVVDAAVDEVDSDVEEHSLGDIDFNSAFIWEGWTIMIPCLNHFVVILDHRTQL